MQTCEGIVWNRNGQVDSYVGGHKDGLLVFSDNCTVLLE